MSITKGVFSISTSAVTCFHSDYRCLEIARANQDKREWSITIVL